VSLIANYRSQFTRVLAAYPYSEVLARLGGSRSDAPTMAQETVPAAQAEPTAPRIPPVTQSPWSANAAATPLGAGTALSPWTFQEIHRISLASEVLSSERVWAPTAAQVSEIREKSLPARDGEAAGAYWIQLGVFQSVGAAAYLSERFRRDGATISMSWLTNAAGNQVGVSARVRVGPFADRSEAQSKLRDLSARGQVGLIAEVRD
jgi:cell division septation protein DedD